MVVYVENGWKYCLHIFKSAILSNKYFLIFITLFSRGNNMSKELFEKFNSGSLRLPEGQIDFDKINWNKHPTFEGVELKHIITAKDTGGDFSYHLVRIAPNKSIKNHIHETQLETHEVFAGYGKCINDGKALDYEPGVISIMPAKVPHEVNAGPEGLYLFAKFFPALC